MIGIYLPVVCWDLIETLAWQFLAVETRNRTRKSCDAAVTESQWKNSIWCGVRSCVQRGWLLIIRSSTILTLSRLLCELIGSDVTHPRCIQRRKGTLPQPSQKRHSRALCRAAVLFADIGDRGCQRGREDATLYTGLFKGPYEISRDAHTCGPGQLGRMLIIQISEGEHQQ